MNPTPSRDGRSDVALLDQLPTRAQIAKSLGFTPEKTLVVFDRRLRKRPGVAAWLRQFDLTYGVEAGEALKDANELPNHLRKMTKLLGAFAPRASVIVTLGGGTVGDFAGFVASVLKRGVPLVHVPTTLLAAVDSAHGGKTALNLGGVKNQIGTIYPAAAVLIARALFEGLPAEQVRAAACELAKIALITGESLFDDVRAVLAPDLATVWRVLPAAIEAKYAVVARDPFELGGERQVLNFGHSLGHALEGYHHLPHGLAIGEGMIFAIAWSVHQGYFRGGKPAELIRWLTETLGLLGPAAYARAHRPMSRAKLEKFLSGDKKMTDARHVNFVFLEDVGKPLRKRVPIESLLTETQRQGWTAV